MSIAVVVLAVLSLLVGVGLGTLIGARSYRSSLEALLRSPEQDRSRSAS